MAFIVVIIAQRAGESTDALSLIKMPALEFQKSPPSRLTLGTVQFGLDYGIANRTGRPSFAAVLDMVREAAESGVDVLDTAPSYGESEEWLGRALRELGLQDRMRV